VNILDLNKNRVGNGGFSLRSKRLLELCSELDFDNIQTSSLSEDLIICYYFYDWFKAQSIKFAPLEVAIKFSFEQPIEEFEKFSWENTFGFHGKLHVVSILNKLSQDFNLDYFANKLKLRDINLIIFPDWTQAEEELGFELQEVIQALANHPENQKITLIIHTGNLTIEDAEMFLSSVAMNLLMIDLDFSNTIEISFIDKLENMQWQSLLPRIYARVILNNEAKIDLAKMPVTNLKSYPLDSLINQI
ncbi:MAG: DUF5672 family protein, partial [Dolichospermum sp.]